MGWFGWTLAVLALLGIAALGIWQYAHRTGAVALLDRVDRTIGGTAGSREAANGVRYGALAAQRIDIVVPTSPGPHPVVVFIHGGSWRSGRPEDYHFVGRALAREGYVVVLPGYRLAPEGRFPAMLEDGAAAVGWTFAHIAEHGGDPQRIVLMGQSAGAHSALMLGLERQWLGRQGLPDDALRGVIGLSGPYDFYPFTSDSSRAAFGHVSDPAITQPVTFARGDAPPLLLLTGDADTTVKPRNSAALADAVRKAGGQVEHVVVPGVDHAGTVTKLAHPFRRDDRVIAPVLAFLNRVTAAAPDRPSAPVQAPAGQAAP